MQVTKTTPAFTGKAIKIDSKLNKEVKYLYNKVVDIVSHPDHRVPAVFSTDKIVIEGGAQKNMEIVTNLLKESGIKFDRQV